MMLRRTVRDVDPMVVERTFQSQQIAGWLDCLYDRERRVIERRFGLGNDQPNTLEEIGADMGVTRERVRQIEAKALKKLMAAAGVPPAPETATAGSWLPRSWW